MSYISILIFYLFTKRNFAGNAIAKDMQETLGVKINVPPPSSGKVDLIFSMPAVVSHFSCLWFWLMYSF